MKKFHKVLIITLPFVIFIACVAVTADYTMILDGKNPFLLIEQFNRNLLIEKSAADGLTINFIDERSATLTRKVAAFIK